MGATGELQADHAVLVNVSAAKIVAAKGAIAYNIVDNSEEGLVLSENEVRVGVFVSDRLEGPSYFEMRSNVLEIDGGQFFREKVAGNDYSFQEVYDLNQGVNVSACARMAQDALLARRAAL